jgi:hypothetical protein
MRWGLRSEGQSQFFSDKSFLILRDDLGDPLKISQTLAVLHVQAGEFLLEMFHLGQVKHRDV